MKNKSGPNGNVISWSQLVPKMLLFVFGFDVPDQMHVAQNLSVLTPCTPKPK